MVIVGVGAFFDSMMGTLGVGYGILMLCFGVGLCCMMLRWMICSSGGVIICHGYCKMSHHTSLYILSKIPNIGLVGSI